MKQALLSAQPCEELAIKQWTERNGRSHDSSAGASKVEVLHSAQFTSSTRCVVQLARKSPPRPICIGSGSTSTSATIFFVVLSFCIFFTPKQRHIQNRFRKHFLSFIGHSRSAGCKSSGAQEWLVLFSQFAATGCTHRLISPLIKILPDCALPYQDT